MDNYYSISINDYNNLLNEFNLIQNELNDTIQDILNLNIEVKNNEIFKFK